MNNGVHKESVLPLEESQPIPFKAENNAGTIFWALTNASLGAFIAFTLLSRSKGREESLKRRIVWIVLAASALTFGCCACQLSTARIHLLQPQQGADEGAFISFNIGFIILSVFVATLLIVSAFSLLNLRLGRESLRRGVVLKSCACSLLVGLSVGFMHYLPFLYLPSFKATFIPFQICLVLLLVISGSLISLLVLTFLINKYNTSTSTTLAFIMLHALVSLIMGSCILGAGTLALSGIKFEVKGSSVISEGPSDGARKQREVLTRAVPAIISAILACATVFLIFTGTRSGSRHRSERLYAHAYPIPDSSFHPSRPGRTPRLTLASIAFGPDGRILVNQKGMLPVQSVNLEDLPEDILDELDSSRSSSAFHWLLAISCDWSIVSPFLRRITSPRVRIRMQNSPYFHSSSSFDDKRRALWPSIFPSVFCLTRSLFTRITGNGKSQSSQLRSPSDAVSASASVPPGEGGEESESQREEVERGEEEGGRTIRAQAQGKLRLRLLEASTQLAAQLDLPLEKLGTLHDRALETGSRIGITEFLSLSEQGPSFVRDTREFKANVGGRGLMLFFVRVLPQQQQQQQSQGQDSSEAVRGSDSQRPEGLKGTLRADGGGDKDNVVPDLRSYHRQGQYLPPRIDLPVPRGFKMRFMGRFRDVLAETTGAKPEEVDKVLNGCKNTATRKSSSVLEAGCTYVSLFVEQVSCDGSSEVLVYDFAKHQIPSYRLDLPALTKEMRDWLHNMSGFTASDIVEICKDEAERGRLISAQLSGDHTFACDWEDERLQQLERLREREVEATLVEFKEALAKALARLMSDMCFVGEGLESWTYLTSHVLDVPSVQVDSDSSDSGPAPPAHMIIFHAEIPDPLDAELLEGESDFTHLSASSASASASRQQMPSVFEFIPRTLFDVVHALAVSQPAREAFRVEAAKELEWLTSDEYARVASPATHARDRRLASSDTGSSDASRTGGQAPGRLSRALVSSFSVDSLSDEESGSHRSTGAISARVKKSWASVKKRARTLSLSRKSGRREDGSHRSRTRKDQIPLSSSISLAQSASRTNLLSHSHTYSSSTTATTNASVKTRASDTTSFSIPIPFPVPMPIAEPQPIVYSNSRTDRNLNLNPYPLYSRSQSYLHSRSAVELTSGPRTATSTSTTINAVGSATAAVAGTTILNAGVPTIPDNPTSDRTRRDRSQGEGQKQGHRSRSHGRSRSRGRRSRWLDVPESVPIPIPVPLPVAAASGPNPSGVPQLPLPSIRRDLDLPREVHQSRRSVIYGSNPNSGTGGSGSGSGSGNRRSVATAAFRSTPDVGSTAGGLF